MKEVMGTDCIEEIQLAVASALRNALRRLAKAVVVITCETRGIRFAMAATAVSELSMDPPSMLICVNQRASIYAPLQSGADFCINILHESHESISRACGGAAKGEDRFAVGRWTAGVAGSIRLEDAQASIVCQNERRVEYGTHGVFIGRVIDVHSHGPVEPLIYVDGSYISLERRLDP